MTTQTIIVVVLALLSIGVAAWFVARRPRRLEEMILGGRVVRELRPLSTRTRGLATIELSAVEVEIDGMAHLVLCVQSRAPLARSVNYVPLTPQARSRLGALITEMDAEPPL